ncbi:MULTISPECIES: hypothetical protein [Methylobacterium]|jgi:hypothetical protein|uniref:Uncharacterized protein n=1 Tax=Methylobacterium goesingense TaxID=243690 RepID=A0ABV2L0J3_9HYPH|nr:MULTISPECIES: hypothetical protein [Methylobacterium]MBY0256908.1 hypothetical protein [Methylobacterium sp.]MCJ2045427.1 hypothetical protein [Methylobacterium sp. J-078]GJD74600.1 hypothetical protein CFIICLFH_2834 [Methylobacterium goesingense]
MDNPAPGGAPRRLVLLAPDDTGFAARFLPLVAAARSAGLAATVVTRVDAHRGAIEAAGARVVPFALGTSRINPMAAGYEAGQLAGILKALEADLLHAIGLRAIVVGGTAAAMSGIGARIYQPDDLAALGARTDAAGRLTRFTLRQALRGALATRTTRYLCETTADAAALGLDPADTALALVGADGLGAAAATLYGEFARA